MKNLVTCMTNDALTGKHATGHTIVSLFVPKHISFLQPKFYFWQCLKFHLFVSWQRCFYSNNLLDTLYEALDY